MKNTILYLLCATIIYSCGDLNKSAETLITTSVSDSLAHFRQRVLKNIQYSLHFDIPAQKEDSIKSKLTLEFDYLSKPDRMLSIDFKEDSQKVKSIYVNNELVFAPIKQEHILIEPHLIKEGKNTITIDFIAGNNALNRRDDFLYSLFVPDRARTVFPCFDQPDLKAVFNLSLTIPSEWTGIANGILMDSTIDGNKKTLHFAPSDVLPTYLFSFTAGNFKMAKAPWRNQQIELLYRETDNEKIANSLPQIFDQFKKYILYYEEWTGIPYPFQKYGMVAIPDFQFGGMEHPGAILLQSSTMFLTKDATESQLNSRAQLLAHELAHMWFGDLVTMKWFDDVWMKEVFANFMGNKATSAPGKEKDFELKFLVDHVPQAFTVDRTLGANPIRQPLNNLENAGTLYGNIIYHKAPIMMRQLEHLMGEKEFQLGVQEYLKTYSYSNASWPDLIHILSKRTSIDLLQWNKVWVNETGRPIFEDSILYNQSLVNDYYLKQKPEFGNERLWPQNLDISFYFTESVKRFELNDSLKVQKISQILGAPTPSFVQYNTSGMGYGVWPVDTSVYPHLFAIADNVSRASAYINLYENMLNGRYLNPETFIELFSSGLQKEIEELNLRLLTQYISTTYWGYLPPDHRKAVSETLENKVWLALASQKKSNNKKILFNCYQNIFQSSFAEDQLFQIWQKKNPPSGLVLQEDDYTNLAFAIALRKDRVGMLDEQLNRIQNPDRKKRFEIIRPALSFDQTIRDSFFNSLSLKKNRSNESAIGAALGYLHHPLRQPTAEKYLTQTLVLLPEIQKTGDIFFPGNWLGSSFGNYQSKTAFDVVQTFLKTHPEMPSFLTNKILQSTDNLRRAQALVQ